MKNIYFYITVLILIAQIACGGLNDKQRKATETALSELRKLDAATEVGISKIEYSKMLINAQATINEATNVLPDGELKTGLADTMQSYIDAKTVWNIMKDDTFFFACAGKPDLTGKSDVQKSMAELFCNPEGGELVIKYKIPLRDSKTGEINETNGKVLKKEAVSVIWQSAKEKLHNTAKLIN